MVANLYEIGCAASIVSRRRSSATTSKPSNTAGRWACPLVGSLGDGLWEVRSQLREGIAQVLFLATEGLMVVLHGFVKKSRKTPSNELETARRRAAKLRGDQ